MNETKKTKQASNPIYHDGFYYTLSRKVSKLGQITRYFHCRKNSRTYHCPATMKMDGVDQNIILLHTKHNHPTEVNYAQVKEFKRTLQRMVMEHAGNSRGYLHTVYKTAAKLHPDAAVQCAYNKIESTLRKWHHSRSNNDLNEISRISVNTNITELEIFDCGSGFIQISEDQPPPLVLFNKQRLTLQTPVPSDPPVEFPITPDLGDHPYAEQPVRIWLPHSDERIELNEPRLLCVICGTFVKKYRLECGHLFCGACAARIYTQNKPCYICHKICESEPQIIYL